MNLDEFLELIKLLTPEDKEKLLEFAKPLLEDNSKPVTL